MDIETIDTCSPYLNQTRRDLHEACRDITRRYQIPPPHCQACSLLASCRGADRGRAAAELRPHYLAGEDHGLAHEPLVPDTPDPGPGERNGRHAA